jgi:hypothetical protein
LRAWGYDDNEVNGYIRVNNQAKVGFPTYNSLPRGITTIVLNITTCTTSNLNTFDTFASTSNSDALVNYLKSLKAGTILLGVSFDDAAAQLTPAAVQALASIGANVAGLGFRWKFLFIAEIGCSSLTKFNMAQNGGDNLLLSAEVPGSSSRYF